jgi:hypothetical protein
MPIIDSLGKLQMIHNDRPDATFLESGSGFARYYIECASGIFTPARRKMRQGVRQRKNPTGLPAGFLGKLVMRLVT